MGFYIETPEPNDKAGQIIRLHGAEPASPVGYDFAGPDALICVVSNGFFDAAGICHSPSERDHFATPDGRPKRWIKLPKAKAVELCPKVKDWLK